MGGAHFVVSAPGAVNPRYATDLVHLDPLLVKFNGQVVGQRSRSHDDLEDELRRPSVDVDDFPTTYLNQDMTFNL